MAKKILIIDDEPDVAKMLVLRLKAKGYEVSVSADAKEGLAALEAFRPDLLLLDYHLSDMLAPIFVQEMRAKGLGQIPVILITATTESVTKKAQECSAADYILKPIEPEELYEKVSKYLSASA
ncbi:MAG: response regulator [Candidatus Omnitrophica bacterium]|nr:response regulator [Candidatus Omnitrophota bacterium]